MFTLITQFKEDTEAALKKYEQLFSDDNPMSVARSIDIIDIRGLLEKSYPHLDDCIQALQDRMEQFETGWWIFKTGNSRLLDNLKDVIENYKQPLIRALYLRFQDIENQNSEFEQRQSKRSHASQPKVITTPNEPNDLKQTLARTQRALKKSEEARKVLEKQVQRLQEKIPTLPQRKINSQMAFLTRVPGR